MAAEEKEVKEEVVQPPAKKSSKLLIIILLITGLIIGGGGAAAFLVLKNMKSDDKNESSEKKSASADKGKDMQLGPILQLDPFIVNLAGAGGRNYLKLEISLELDKVELETEIKNKMPRIKDTVLLLLSSKSFADIQHADGKLMLKNEIITLLNKFLASGTVKNLYFTNFVVQ